MEQNIFDNKEFFREYKKLRERRYNYNILQEKPAIFSLLPDLKGKSILDMGCGFGENSEEFIKRGASEVFGIDISENMLEKAIKENNHINVDYEKMNMTDISSLDRRFDVAFSSLAIHYIDDFDKLLKDVHSILNPDGIFIFSQEHPLTTAPVEGVGWIVNDEGDQTHYLLSNYMNSGKRNVTWFIDDIIKYHRPFSELINSAIGNGFQVEGMLEPLPSESDIKKIPNMKKDIHKPNFLIMKLRKA